MESFKKTPHISADLGDIANIVLMPGDPLRAKLIAEKYLDDYKLVNEVRNMLAYTGYYKGKRITVMGSGMGMASMGIYCYELFKFYNVDAILRIGSCGSFQEQVKIFDLILVDKAHTHSNFSKSQNNTDINIMQGDAGMNEIIKSVALEKNKSIHTGTIHCSDIFYNDNPNMNELIEKHNALGVEMESYALFHYAKVLNKKAACLLTVSDSLVTKEETSSFEREQKLIDMIEIALESAIRF